MQTELYLILNSILICMLAADQKLCSIQIFNILVLNSRIIIETNIYFFILKISILLQWVFNFLQINFQFFLHCQVLWKDNT